MFDGNGNFALFDVRAADYTYFEGLTFRNAEVAILAGTQFIAGAKGLTVKRSRFEAVGAGVFTNFAGSSNFYIADSTFLGRNDPKHLIGWAGDALWAKFNGVDGQVFPPKMASYVAVKLYGPGHVVAYNHITDFHDGINVETYGNPDGSVASGPGIPPGPRYPPREYFDRRPVAIDFYNNYISSSHDNPIEADGGMHNIRVMRNLFINHASHAFCNQPALGGPVYWIRNIAYNLPGGSTRLTNGSAGAVFYNNTILSETQAALASNVHWRNNLILGQNAAPADLQRHDDDQLFVVGLQRLPPQPRRGRVVPLERPAAVRPGRHDRAGPGRGAADPRVPDARRLQQGVGAGPAQPHRGLRHLRQRPAPRRAGRLHGAEHLPRRRVRLPVEAGRRAGGPGSGAADRDRRVHRPRARHRRARGGAAAAALRPAPDSRIELRILGRVTSVPLSSKPSQFLVQSYLDIASALEEKRNILWFTS